MTTTNTTSSDIFAHLYFIQVMFFRAILTEIVDDRKAAIDRFERAIALGEEHWAAYSAKKTPKGIATWASHLLNISAGIEIEADSVASYALDAHVVIADGYTILATLQMMEEQRIKGIRAASTTQPTEQPLRFAKLKKRLEDIQGDS